MAYGGSAGTDSDSGAKWSGDVQRFTPKQRAYNENRARQAAKHKAAIVSKRRKRTKAAKAARKANR